MRCLVTGVAGFIGSHLANRLLADGHDVCGIDAFIDYYPRSLKERNLACLHSWNRFTFLEGDLLVAHLPPLLDGVDLVFHQAAQAGVRSSWRDGFALYLDCNVLATQRLLEAALQVESIQRFVYASSSSVYGETNVLPIVESAIPQPFSPYGVTKLAGEHLCSLYYNNFGVPTTSLRYFTVYGPRQRPDMAFHRFCKAAITRQPVRIYGDGLQTRDFTYIDDVVEANVRAATVPSAIGKVFNVAGGSRVTIRTVLQTLEEVVGSSIPVTFEDVQHGDVRHTWADTHLAEEIIGYHPQVPLRDGLAREFEDLRGVYASTLTSAVL
jgi:nucleoside-diphosphate-sugar epimerase